MQEGFVGNILSHIGISTGNDWEALCVDCYRMRYQSEHYVEIPAAHGGDTGIEGYTQSGIVHQCYFPERTYSDPDLYEHLRNKLTADIEKLKNNAQRFGELGVPPVKEWHFNIPEYKDSRIIQHAEAKRKELLEAKRNNADGFLHICDDIKLCCSI